MLWKSACNSLLAVLIAVELVGKVRADDTCSCDCCTTAGNQRSEQHMGSEPGQSVVCAEDVSEDEPHGCPSSCVVTPDDSVITNEPSIPLLRYCAYNCVPTKPDVGATCRHLTDQEMGQLLTAGGNGAHLAELAKKQMTKQLPELVDPDAPPEPPQLLDQQALAAALAGAPAPGPQTAEQLAAALKKEQEEGKQTGAMVAQASGKNAMASGIAARIADAEALSARGRALADGDLQSSRDNSFLVVESYAQVQAAEVRASIYATSAKKAAARAQADLKAIQEIPKKAAAYATQKAREKIIGELQDLANREAIVKARLAPPPLPVPLAEAAVRAAQPYYNVMSKAVAMGGLYEQSARSLQDQAQTLQRQSRDFASQAVAYQGAGYPDMAAHLMDQAKTMMKEAATKNDQAVKDFNVAEGVQKEIPVYQANAALASARATAIANPAGQPPPVMAAASFVQQPSFLRKSSKA